MPTDEELIQVMEGRPAEVADAILSIQSSFARPRPFDVLIGVAEAFEVDPNEYILHEFLDPNGLRPAFVQALRARGIVFRTAHDEEPDVLDLLQGSDFLQRAYAFRCKVEAGDPVASIGSGCLISPHLVLTASHVVKRSSDDGGEFIEPVRVVLSDGTRRQVVGSPVYLSECAPADYGVRWPADDSAYDDLHDVALLRLETAEGVKFGYPPLPQQRLNGGRGSRGMMLLHFPEGKDVRGVSVGKTRKIRGLTARVGHDATAAAGSSGGPCFGLDCSLLGIHQGRWEGRRRMVPVHRFDQNVRDEVDRDIAPQALWSLSETTAGRLVFGRDELFGAFAEASNPDTRARGLRMLRSDPDASEGMLLNYEVVQRLVQLRANAAGLVRIPISASPGDLIEFVRISAALAGHPTPPISASPGVAAGETTPEASARDRAMQLMGSLNEAAKSSLLWLYFEEDAVLTEADQIALEMLIETSFSQPALRVVLAGCEGVATPGESFTTPGMAIGSAAAGMIEVPVQPFSLMDVRLCLQRASRALGRPEESDDALNMVIQLTVLSGINDFNGRYPLSAYPIAEQGLRRLLWPEEIMP